MRALGWGAWALLGGLGACLTEREQAEQAAEDLREEGREVGQEVRREVEEGQEEIQEARRNLAEELRNQERSGEAVTFGAVVLGHDTDSLNLRLEDGEAFEVAYGPGSRFRRGGEDVALTDLAPGQAVTVTYRIVDGRRMLESVEVVEAREGGTPGMEGAPGVEGAPPPAGGGTR
jgi:hypothetical protein